MKILVISLLRLGDLIMAAKAISGIKIKYPNAEVHLLTNKSNSPIAKLLSDIDRVHYFERDQCQKSIGESNRSIFEATDRIQDLVARMNSYNFDKLINLTQNRISAHLSGMIEANDYHGMLTSETGVTHLSSAWFRHLNNYIAGNGSDVFHYIDLFRLALGLEETASDKNVFKESDKKNLCQHEQRICVQAWSSDKKKDYSDKSWKAFFKEILCINPNLKFSVLAAPNEKERAKEFIDNVSQEKLDIEPAVLKFDELINYLPRQEALISVDTSVKHFAGELGIKVIELALGSSNPSKTGIYSEGSLVIKSRSKCSPCSHFSSCDQPSFICEEAIDPRFMAMAVNEFIKGNWPSLRVLAEEYREQAYIGRVGKTDTGLWYSQSLHPVEWQTEKETIINLESWKFTLNKKYLELVPPFKQVAKALVPTIMDPHKLMVDRLESVSRQSEMDLDRVSRMVHDTLKDLAKGDQATAKEINKELVSLEKDLKLGDYLSQYLDSIEKNGISSIRSLRESLNELRNFQVAKTNILRNIQKADPEVRI